jgi:hypothetical protein
VVEKEYGKLTEDQFKRLISKLPEVRKQSKQAEEALRAASKERLRALLGDGIWWAPVYELTFVEGLAHLVCVFGLAERVKAFAGSPDPQEAAIRYMESDEDIQLDGGPGEQFATAYRVALVTALQRNIFSLMLYKKSVSALVAEAREGGEQGDKALFDAIRVDRSVVSCPTAALRISKAELLGEKQFFLRLKSALKGPSNKHWEGYKDLRYSLVVLREMGFGQMSDAQLEHLLVKVLKVYPDTPSARKNLRKQFYESKKIKSL